MKALRVLAIAIVALFAFEGAKAQVVVKARVGAAPRPRTVVVERPVYRRTVVATRPVYRRPYHRTVVVERPVVVQRPVYTRTVVRTRPVVYHRPYKRVVVRRY